MPTVPNVLRAMQSIQADSEEALRSLGSDEASKPSNALFVGLCTDILKNIWRTSNDYVKIAPTVARPSNHPEEDNLGTIHLSDNST